MPINLLQKSSEIAYVMNNAGISGLIYHELFQAQVNEALPQLKSNVFEIRISNEAEKSIAWESSFKK